MSERIFSVMGAGSPGVLVFRTYKFTHTESDVIKDAHLLHRILWESLPKVTYDHLVKLIARGDIPEGLLLR